MSKKQGRRSPADLAASKYISTLVPPRELSAAERAVWDRVTGSMAENHFCQADAYLLLQFCALHQKFEEAVVAGEFATMEKASKCCANLARALRISPITRNDSRAAQRHADAGRIPEILGGNSLLGSVDWPDRDEGVLS
jgi:hypothetical protein